MTLTLLAADQPQPVAVWWQLILAALAGIALIVVLITVVKLHPFLALIFGSLAVGSVAGENPERCWSRSARVSAPPRPAWEFSSRSARCSPSFSPTPAAPTRSSTPWSATRHHVHCRGRWPPRRRDHRAADVLRDRPGPADAGDLSRRAALAAVADHRRHPGTGRIVSAGPLVAISNLNANLGITLALGVAVAIPTVIVAGPLFGRLAGRWVVLQAPDRFSADGPARRRPAKFAGTPPNKGGDGPGSASHCSPCCCRWF